MSSFSVLRRAGARTLALVLPSLLAAATAGAQAAHQPPAAPPSPWKGSALANASVFFGNTSQQVLGADGKLARVDSAFGLSAELQALYGEAAVDTGPRIVTKRLWMGTMIANFRPMAPVSSFVTGTYESNLEKRIASRYSAGVGAKWNIVRDPTTDANLSLSLSAERTTARDSTVHFPDERIARVSWLAKYHHLFDHRMEVTHATSWQPSASGKAQFLVSSNTQFQYKMNGTVSLSLAITDNYDSGALTRGARTYNDGQMLFGVAAGW
ncbi:MAG TPA: DUF481 domain-containing protein [Gemmatimonadaceae bacterium]|nr:DUF481 domain-containing protein [Gemmatimonadaceae bacterium]